MRCNESRPAIARAATTDLRGLAAFRTRNARNDAVKGCAPKSGVMLHSCLRYFSGCHPTTLIGLQQQQQRGIGELTDAQAAPRSRLSHHPDFSIERAVIPIAVLMSCRKTGRARAPLADFQSENSMDIPSAHRLTSYRSLHHFRGYIQPDH